MLPQPCTRMCSISITIFHKCFLSYQISIVECYELVIYVFVVVLEPTGDGTVW
jgi:hypothetical protein